MAGQVIHIDEIVMWVGSLDKLPKCLEKYKTSATRIGSHWIEGSFDITVEDFLEASKENSVAIFAYHQQQPTKKELAKGAEPLPDLVMLAIDEKYKRFNQR